MSKKNYSYSSQTGDLPIDDMLERPRRRSTRRVTAPVGDVSLTRQEMASECDINNIMKRYERTGILDHVARYQGRYEDVSDAADYMTALGIVADVHQAFLSLPASIRERFNNDPGEFLDFAQNPDNRPAMMEMGLLPRPKGEPDKPVITPEAKPEEKPKA